MQVSAAVLTYGQASLVHMSMRRACLCIARALARPLNRLLRRSGAGGGGGASPCGPFQAWTKPLPPPQGRGQPLRGSGLAHPFHCKTPQPLPVDNWRSQLPTAIDCHQFFKNSSFWETKQPNSLPTMGASAPSRRQEHHHHHALGKEPTRWARCARCRGARRA